MSVFRGVPAALVVCAALALGGCDTDTGSNGVDEGVAPATATPTPSVPEPQPTTTDGDPFGDWIAPDGSAVFIHEDGECTGIYFDYSASVEGDGSMTCEYSGNQLTVTQATDAMLFWVHYSGDTMILTHGAKSNTFTRG